MKAPICKCGHTKAYHNSHGHCFARKGIVTVCDCTMFVRAKAEKPAPKKRKKPFAANNASTKKLESEGWTVCTVEQRLPHCFITRDAFGFCDLLAISPSRGILAVQATGGGNGPSRIAKIKAEPRAGIWLAAGGRIQVHDWRKRAKQKDRECVVIEITKENNQ